MSILLDTHYVFGLAGSPGRLSQREVEFLQAPHRRFVISAVSIWEIRLKWSALHRSGRRKGPAAPNDVVRILTGQSIDFLDLTTAHAAAELESAISHGDPFDELLLAQAQVEGLKLLTRDSRLADHPLATRIDAQA